MSTNVYAAKRAFFHRLAQIASEGGPWDGIQVAYAWPGNEAGSQLVYGGQGLFDHAGDADLIEGKHRLIDESAFFWVHVRVKISPKPDGGVEVADIRAEQILDLVGFTLALEPTICGGNSEATIRNGQADYSEDDDGVTSICSAQVGVRSFVDPLNLGS